MQTKTIMMTVSDLMSDGKSVVAMDVSLELSGVKISDTDFSGNHAAICTSSKPDSNLSKNSPISSAGFLQPTLEWGRILL